MPAKSKLDKALDESAKLIKEARANKPELCLESVVLNDGRPLFCERWQHEERLGEEPTKHEAWYRGHLYEWGGQFDDAPEMQSEGHLYYGNRDGTTPAEYLCYRDLGKVIRITRGMTTWEGVLKRVEHISAPTADQTGVRSGVQVTIGSTMQSDDWIVEIFDSKHPVRFPSKA